MAIQEMIIQKVDGKSLSASMVVTKMEFDDEHLCVIVIRKDDKYEKKQSAFALGLPALTMILELNKNGDSILQGIVQNRSRQTIMSRAVLASSGRW